MERPIDFSKLTLEELTPIVSMRPGKEYTREELKEARAAFMSALGVNSPSENETPPESQNEGADIPTDSMHPAAPSESEKSADAENETVFSVATPIEADANAILAMDIASTEDIDSVPTSTLSVPNVDTLPSENVNAENTAMHPAASSSPAEMTPEAEEDVQAEEPFLEEKSEEAAQIQIATPDEEAKEEFILKAESRLARFLYILYAYVLLPILAAESLIFLLGSVATAIMVRDVPFVFVHILAAVLYSMLVSLAWHQFLHRTELGLLLNRSLIGVCIFRGFSMLLSGSSLMTGIIYIALSLLYLVFFVAYDTTFVIPSQD